MGGVLKTHSSPFAIAHFFAKKCSAKFLLISLSFLNFSLLCNYSVFEKKEKNSKPNSCSEHWIMAILPTPQWNYHISMIHD